MKKSFYLFFTAAVFAALLSTVSLSCSALSFAQDFSADSGKKTMLKIANWNVQTFFDATTSGTEYDEFVKSKTWCEDFYRTRLERLCSVIKALDADIFVMEELENEGVLQDISNFLAGEWNLRKVYTHACFAKDKDGSIGCGVLSRVPLQNMTVHAIDCRTGEAMPSMRPLMQVEVLAKDKRAVLFVNHWKSMSGGQEESEQWRMRQEAVLASRVALEYERHVPVIICGDFNRDIKNFCSTKKSEEILLRFLDRAPFPDGVNSGVTVTSAWYSDGRLTEPGSYYFNDSWSRIDNFFVGGGTEIAYFSAETDGSWCDPLTGTPLRFSVWNGSGYSDHLPLICTVRF